MLLVNKKDVVSSGLMNCCMIYNVGININYFYCLQFNRYTMYFSTFYLFKKAFQNEYLFMRICLFDILCVTNLI